jgi:hypothetical protein
VPNKLRYLCNLSVLQIQFCVFGIDNYSVEKVEEEEELGTSMRSKNI